MKIAMLIPKTPNPRTLKRITALLSKYEDISLLYWDRKLPLNESFDVEPNVNVQPIKVKAPQGRPFLRAFTMLPFSIKLIIKLFKLKPNILHVENLDMLFLTTIYKLFFNRRLKIIYEVADLQSFVFKRRKFDPIKGIIRYIEKKLTRNVHYLFLTSTYFWDIHFSKFIQNAKYVFVPNVPYQSQFKNYQFRLNSENKLTIGFIGSVRYFNQIKMLIDVVSRYQLDLNILIAGSGPSYSKLKDYSESFDFVKLTGPYNYKYDIVALYEKIDLCFSVYDSNLENVKYAIPNRLFESIITETPIIVSKDTALCDFVMTNNIGHCVHSHSPDDLAELLKKVTFNFKLIEEKKNNMNRIKSKYIYENISSIILDVYKDLE